MILDSSAIMAIIFDEAEADRLLEAIGLAQVRKLSYVTWLECLLVSEGQRGTTARLQTQTLLIDMQAEAIPFDATHMSAAFSAWSRFGKGRHRARLNLGDCCAYAATQVTGEPLLYKGGDFALTDVVAAPY